MFYEVMIIRQEIHHLNNQMRYNVITDEIRSILKFDKTQVDQIALLSRERDALKYNPDLPRDTLSTEEIRVRCDSLLDRFSEKEMSHYMDGKVDAARVCDMCREYVQTLITKLPTNASPAQIHPIHSSFRNYSFKYGTSSITLNEEKCKKRESNVSGVFFGEFSIFGTAKKAVAIKVWREGRDLHHEYTILKALNGRSECEDKFIQVFSLEFNNLALHRSLKEYLLLEDFGSDLRVVMKSDNQVFRKKIVVPLLLKVVDDLHQENIMHGDLKPQNVLVRSTESGNCQLKLCDFDNARLVGEPFCRNHFGNYKFSSSWVSPEVFNAALSNYSLEGGSLLANLTIDLFSLGLLIEVLCRKNCDPSSTVLPTVGEDPDYHQLRKLLSDQMTLFEKVESLHGEGKSQTEIVRQLLDLNPLNRGNIHKIRQQYHNAIEGTIGLHRHRVQSQRIAELNELIVRFGELDSGRGVSRDVLEETLSDQIVLLSNMMQMHTSEIIERLCAGAESRRELSEILTKIVPT